MEANMFVKSDICTFLFLIGLCSFALAVSYVTVNIFSFKSSNSFPITTTNISNEYCEFQLGLYHLLYDDFFFRNMYFLKSHD
jgi:hypothetical protein